jgi:hypothetical protein
MWPQTGQDGASPWFWKVLVTVRAVATGALWAGATRAAGLTVAFTRISVLPSSATGSSGTGRFTFFLSSSMRPGMGSSAWPAPAGDVASR